MAVDIYVHSFGGKRVYCPWKEKLLKLDKCLECQYNEGRSFYKLSNDEVRGLGFIKCNYRK
jgi:hypothetical protein